MPFAGIRSRLPYRFSLPHGERRFECEIERKFLSDLKVGGGRHGGVRRHEYAGVSTVDREEPGFDSQLDHAIAKTHNLHAIFE